MNLDAHQHFWKYDPAEYAWIDDRMARIRRDFLPDDLAPHLKRTGVDGSIAVQARQSVQETQWLLELAHAFPAIKGVVGWVPLKSPDLPRTLEAFVRQSALRGVRHVVQAEPDGFLDDPAFDRGLRCITQLQLTYDILIFSRQLSEATRLVDRHPNQRFVLDHIAKPRIDSHQPDATWVAGIRELAKRPHVFCKFSGVVTEVVGWDWTETQLRPYFDVVLEAFGAQRLMFGSDWPVCLVASGYERWHSFVRSCAASLTQEDQSWIFGRAAAAAYRLA